MKVDVLTLNSKIFIVAVTLLTVSFLTASAQTAITVSTDKTSYSDGDTITISGKVADQLHVPISIIIKDDTSHNIAYLTQTNPGTDGTYSTQAVAGGSTWKSAGTYEVDVTYGGPDKTATTTFEFTSSSTPVQNQTNNTVTPAIPEFGPLSVSIFAISIAIIITYAKMRPTFKI